MGHVSLVREAVCKTVDAEFNSQMSLGRKKGSVSLFPACLKPPIADLSPGFLNLAARSDSGRGYWKENEMAKRAYKAVKKWLPQEGKRVEVRHPVTGKKTGISEHRGFVLIMMLICAGLVLAILFLH